MIDQNSQLFLLLKKMVSFPSTVGVEDHRLAPLAEGLDGDSQLFLLLKKMVSFPSTDGNEAGISDFLAENMRALGMDHVEQQEALPGRWSGSPHPPPRYIRWCR